MRNAAAAETSQHPPATAKSALQLAIVEAQKLSAPETAGALMGVLVMCETAPGSSFVLLRTLAQYLEQDPAQFDALAPGASTARLCAHIERALTLLAAQHRQAARCAR